MIKILIILLLFSSTAFGQRSFFSNGKPSIITPIPPPSYDSDAQDYMDRVEAHGVSLTTPQEEAINDFFIDAKSNSLYTTALFDGGLLIFGIAAANAEKFKGGTDVEWNGTVTHASTGVTSNGTTGYGDLNFTGSALTLNNSRISIYSNTNSPITNAVDIGCASGTTSRCIIFIKSGSNLLSDHNSSTSGSGRISTANADASGYFISSRVSSTDHRVFRNGTQLGTTAVTANNGTFPAVEFSLMGLNTNGTTSAFSTRELKYWDAGEGLSTAQAETWSTLVSNLLAAF